MADKRKILLHLDTDRQPSVFDRIVAFDAGSDEVMSYGEVTADAVRDLVHGAMFTRGPRDLHRTAIFVGGSDVGAGEAVLKKVQDTFLGGLRVSVLLDSSGANTTAVAAVLEVDQVFPLEGRRVLVLGGTGPVGRRLALLASRRGASVRLGSRSLERAREACEALESSREADSAPVSAEPVETSDAASRARALEGVDVVFAAGGPGALLLPLAERQQASGLRVVVDLNAVPPAGIEGVELGDHARERDGQISFGALGVGGRKMKIHRAAIAALFERNDRVLDAEAVLELGQETMA